MKSSSLSRRFASCSKWKRSRTLPIHKILGTYCSVPTHMLSHEWLKKREVEEKPLRKGIRGNAVEYCKGSSNERRTSDANWKREPHLIRNRKIQLNVIIIFQSDRVQLFNGAERYIELKLKSRREEVRGGKEIMAISRAEVYRYKVRNDSVRIWECSTTCL